MVKQLDVGEELPKKGSKASVTSESGSGDDSSDDESKPKATTAFTEDGDRRCTDVGCLILFLLYWFIMFVIAAVGFGSGQPQRLFYGTAHDGEVCGTGNHSTPVYKPRIYFPRLQLDLIAALSQPEKYTPGAPSEWNAATQRDVVDCRYM